MCSPEHFGIEYEINPWMKVEQGSTPERAHRQWQKLRDTLVGLGAAIELLAPQPGLPDLVFTANAGLVFHKRFFSSRFEISCPIIPVRTGVPARTENRPAEF